jgi:hypothetical protein
MKICPKCKQRSNDEQCATCKIIFAEYELKKREQTSQVYKLISAGELEKAKELAQTLSNEFPDSKGDFILLISNINRDLNIAGKYRYAQELLTKGEYSEAIQLLRNLKAFDPGLSEKIIALRRKAERHIGNSSKLDQAVALLEQQQYGAAKDLLLHLSSDNKHKDEVKKHLSKIEEIKKGLLREVADCLSQGLFNAAREHLGRLISQFPEAEQEQAPLYALLVKRKEISERLTAAAHKAREEKRSLEAKVLYAFLIWQDHELKSSLLPYLHEIGSKAVISLADCPEHELTTWASLGITVKEDGFLKSILTEQKGEQLAKIAPVLVSLPSRADLVCEPVHIDGEEVADFA